MHKENILRQVNVAYEEVPVSMSRSAAVGRLAQFIERVGNALKSSFFKNDFTVADWKRLEFREGPRSRKGQQTLNVINSYQWRI